MAGLADDSELQRIAESAEWQALVERLREGANGLPIDLSRLRTTIEEPQVHFFGNGQMVIRGYLTVLGSRQPVRFVTAPRIVGDEISLEFVEGQMGRVPAPRWLFNVGGEGLARALELVQDYVALDLVEISAGTLHVEGRRGTR